MPGYGRTTIRKFAENVSDMKQMAARDFEDILQVCEYMHERPMLLNAEY